MATTSTGRCTRRRPSAPALMFATLVLALLLAACGDNGDGAAADGGSSGLSTDVPTPRSEATPAPATPAPEPSDEEREWATAFCEATATFDAVIDALEDDVDPRTLDLETRRDRGANRYEQHVEGLHDLRDALDEITPPSGATQYHGATIEQTDILIGRISESIDFLREAESHEAIEEELEVLVGDVMLLDDAVTQIYLEAPPEIQRAVQLVPRCGVIVG